MTNPNDPSFVQPDEPSVDESSLDVTTAAENETPAKPSPWARIKKAYGGVISLFADPSKPYFIQHLIAALLIAFFAASAVFMLHAERSQNLIYTNLDFVTGQDIITFALSVVLIAALIMAGSFITGAQKIIPVSMVMSVTAFCFLVQSNGQRYIGTVSQQIGWCSQCNNAHMENHCATKFFDQTGGDRNIWLGVGLALIIFIACRFLFERYKRPFESFKIDFGFVRAIVTVMFVLFVGYMSLMGICRYYSFTYDTFDFGIFAQMFGYMKDTGLPYTTVERNTLLSHFAVHFSPFFYVLLPGYMVFDTPAYLCVAQTLFVGVSVFAVYGIAKTLGFTPKQTLLSCAVFLLYPSMSFGLFFDFHENKFLTFCILYAMYFLLKRKFVPFYIFAVLTCSIKEDSAIFVVGIALFMLLHEKLIKHGLLTLLLAVGYFVFALKMTEICGATEENQFGYRYGMFALEGEATIGNIIKVTIMDFGYTLSQMFQAQKFEFLLWMFLPVLFTPFLTKRISVLILFAPMVLVNFMSNWPYQYHVDYQYTFGTGALIIVAFLLVLKQMPSRKRSMLLTASVMLCLVLTVPRTTDRANGYIDGYLEDEERRETFDQSVAFIDEHLDKEDVIGVEGNVMPMLYDYPFLFLDPHNDELAGKIEYYIAKIGDSDISKLTDRGFEPVADNGYLIIYKNPHIINQ